MSKFGCLQKIMFTKYHYSRRNYKTLSGLMTFVLIFKKFEHPNQDFELSLLKTIEEKIVNKKEKRCEDTLHGEILASKMKKLPYQTKVRAKHEIDNLMFKYEILEYCSMDSSVQQNLSLMESSQIQSPYPIPLLMIPRFVSPDFSEKSPGFYRHGQPTVNSFNLIQL